MVNRQTISVLYAPLHLEKKIRKMMGWGTQLDYFRPSKSSTRMMNRQINSDLCNPPTRLREEIRKDDGDGVSS
jgi:hypothetical protein